MKGFKNLSVHTSIKNHPVRVNLCRLFAASTSTTLRLRRPNAIAAVSCRALCWALGRGGAHQTQGIKFRATGFDIFQLAEEAVLMPALGMMSRWPGLAALGMMDRWPGLGETAPAPARTYVVWDESSRSLRRM